MQRSITIDEAQKDLGKVVLWATEHNEGVILEKSGKAEAVLMPFDQYAELVRLRKKEARRKTQEVLEALSREASERNQDITIEEAYRLAGFSEEVIRETLEYDRKLAEQE